MTTPISIPDQLRAGLAARNWSQGELSRQLGVSRATIYRWCAGTCSPDLHTLERIAGLLGCRFHVGEPIS